MSDWNILSTLVSRLCMREVKLQPCLLLQKEKVPLNVRISLNKLWTDVLCSYYAQVHIFAYITMHPLAYADYTGMKVRTYKYLSSDSFSTSLAWLHSNSCTGILCAHTIHQSALHKPIVCTAFVV